MEGLLAGADWRLQTAQDAATGGVSAASFVSNPQTKTRVSSAVRIAASALFRRPQAASSVSRTSTPAKARPPARRPSKRIITSPSSDSPQRVCSTPGATSTTRTRPIAPNAHIAPSRAQTHTHTSPSHSMPARLSSMENSSPDPDAQAKTASQRRKSGRVTRKPDTMYNSSPAGGATKRKRAGDEGEAENENENAQDDASGEDEESEQSEESEGEPDEEEMREKKRRQAKARKTKSSGVPQRKPVAKKTKVNGEAGMSLAIRPAAGKKKTAARKPRPSKVAAAEDAGGLFAEVFAPKDSLAEVAQDWLRRFQDHESKAVAELVTFVLRCAGCEHTVDEHDIEDPDRCTDKLTEIQEEYQAQNITEYPLIAKGRGTASFKQTLVEFFHKFVETIAQTEVVFEQSELIENVEVWVSTMSSASSRPFRHTATVVSLAIVSALCEVGKGMADQNAKVMRMSEAETRKGKNKSRASAMGESVKKAAKRQEWLNTTIKDWFDTVFVHRYRDVDPRIRVDCVLALSEWIETYPEEFFDGNHLRYLGWVLSDINVPTRLEAARQLQKLYQDKTRLVGLKTFTEKFRPRIVEMATRDADAQVRATAVDLLDTLRDAGLLEPDDIDSVGRLIFDSEPRVRKAVTGFFAETINEFYQLRIEELGGQEAIDEALVTVEDDDDYDSPRVEWLKLKCLVESLQSYDAEEQELPSQIERGPATNSYVLVAAGIESRFSMAAQSFYDHIPEVNEWEILAGYLLFDHSQTTAGAQQNGSLDDTELKLKQECKLDEKEEVILLEILNAAVKLRLTQAVEAGKANTKKNKLTKIQRQQLEEEQDTAARHLAILIPRLLNKFGAMPDAASAVLRLEHVLNLDVFQELRQDNTTYKALIDDVKKQFMNHSDEAVLVEASRALLHARSYDELNEVTEGRVQELWDDTTNALHTLKQGKGLNLRGNVSENILNPLNQTVLRISKLASISDPTEPLEAIPSATKKTARKKQSFEQINAIAILTEIVNRGVPADGAEEDMADLEDQLVANAAKALLFYFMWKVRAWSASLQSGLSIPSSDVEDVATSRDAFVAALTEVLRHRTGADELRLAIAGTLLDLHTLFTTLRQAKPLNANNTNNNTAATIDDDYTALMLEVDPATQPLLLNLLTAAEKAFAKKSNRSLDVEDDDDPIDIDDDPVSSSDDDDDADGANADHSAKTMLKAQEALLAEQRLCELASKIVLGLIAGVLDGGSEAGGADGPLRKRLERNKTRLGANFKEVVAFLAEDGKGGKGKGRAKGGARMAAPLSAAAGKGKAGAKSAEVVVDEEEEDELEDELEEEGEGRNGAAVGGEEDDEEALRRRGLVEDDPIEDEDMAEETERRDEEVDSLLGD